MKLLRFLAGPALTGVIVGLAVLWWHQSGPGANGNRQVVSTGQLATSYADAVNHAAPAVANIYTTQVVTRGETPDDPLFQRFMEEPRRERILASLGSAVIVSQEGYMLTSYHVIRDADEVLVALHDGREAAARIVGIDPETDLALLQIPLDNLPVVRLGDKAPSVGDVVLAIGNPLGVGQTVSMGIVSATGRNLGIATFENFIQTDAAINRGNSGGALIDTQGNLIGINTAILSAGGSWEGIGFASPASTARKVMTDLIEHGRVIRGWLGVTVQDITPNLAASFGLDEARGGLVSEVVRNGPAHQGGLRPGDVLAGINGRGVRDGFEAMNIIAGTAPDTEIELNVIRNREPLTLQVVIGTRPPAQNDRERRH
ncbi:S1C family serine protease [Isoalcanivorax indicus]|uniref:S1C family serine protease n=1 Tax=Isoalcanivorax indicus TaxID=2202653 RepID=UPI000DBA51A2|nr:trypsin-like peptidase domain-containing protein [Isoalcanivorax indicus]